LIGPLILKGRHYGWSEFKDDGGQEIPPKYKRLHLWDGGVYDNLGVESLFKPDEGLREGTDFLIVCDASRRLENQIRRPKWRPGYLAASLRLVDVATDQVRSLRARMLIEYFKQNLGSGAYLRLGLRTKRVYARSPVGGQPALTEDEARQVSQIETTLRRLTHHEFSLLFRHGYEVADATLSTYCNDTLSRVPRNHVLFKAA
jgi:NTE family protein